MNSRGQGEEGDELLEVCIHHCQYTEGHFINSSLKLGQVACAIRGAWKVEIP